jgi:diaminopimelate epimerase
VICKDDNVSGYTFFKGHGTENDFILLPDHDGLRHPDLSAERVRRLCDRRAGIGADGVLRVVRTEAADEPAVAAQAGAAEWFMDYRNSDGSVSEMCGNGVRVFAKHLVQERMVDPHAPLPIATRAGIKILTVDEHGDYVADLGEPRILGRTTIRAGGKSWPALHVNIGNPHAVCVVNDLAEAGTLAKCPEYDSHIFPKGVNVEFMSPEPDQHVAMRVYERGSGETRSCGTGAAAVAVAAALHDNLVEVDSEGVGRPAQHLEYAVKVPGGELRVTWTASDRVFVAGPAVIVASGVTKL